MDIPTAIIMDYLVEYHATGKKPRFAGLQANIGHPYLLVRGEGDKIDNFHHADTLDKAREDGYYYVLPHWKGDFRQTTVWVFENTSKGYKYKGKIMRSYPRNPKSERDFDTVWITNTKRYYVDFKGRVSSKKLR